MDPLIALAFRLGESSKLGREVASGQANASADSGTAAEEEEVEILGERSAEERDAQGREQAIDLDADAVAPAAEPAPPPAVDPDGGSVGGLVGGSDGGSDGDCGSDCDSEDQAVGGGVATEELPADNGSQLELSQDF